MRYQLDYFIEGLLLLAGFMGIVSGAMWTITAPQDRWLWFSRFAFGVVAFGLSGIIRALRSKE